MSTVNRTRYGFSSPIQWAAQCAAVELAGSELSPVTSPSTTPSRITNPSTLIASVWNVFSRQYATKRPQLPAVRAEAAQIASDQSTWSIPTPPSKSTKNSTGTDARISTITISRPAKSLPNTSSSIPHVGHQQQNQRPPVFFLGDAAGSEKQGEKQDQRKLHQRENLEDQAAEPRHIADAADLLPAEHRLTGGVHQHEQGGHVTRSD